ncbi:hypothetical protein COCC4DRAFT_182535 [Bipolaris maydis ATCC 48331]|uniref:Uncharacterized protein n=2 Tax=Cochliobolus heterostrophus TaxID=5016 RepID=M2TUG4_COCH5|nr:uncharacterized protein COCC4DRAFT_182535 [Bipolaris maydis ATCC 48331]EMD90174.1 hypothetical protein COCHEDRAFT_1022221 [Bipolaris maydis C5]KAJ5063755.1 hypothetical protein J3E74DRAFT_471360 [Bipolaris maydis]ENH98646.1 hypothetical protein COCC4DRAFT_182535 [Bipolaris maydis ATCC 48331]KAJ6197093.1 hypothetical protein J3E72DRAFT_386456 [Bipolaris maydis]KAJ6207992.1 hypothetical protein PSV09DRAFT_1022221 [Bipolaris maydis]
MRFIIIIAVGIVTSFALPEQKQSLTSREISALADQPKAVSLEFGKEYTVDEILALHQSVPVSDPRSTIPNQLSQSLKKRAPPSIGTSFYAAFQCPTYGSVTVTQKTRIAITRRRNQDNLVDWTGIDEVSSWGFGDQTQYGVNEPQTSNTATWNFCKSFGTTICAFTFAAQYTTYFLGGYSAVGVDVGIPTLREVCVTVRARNTCPAIDISQAVGCQVQATRKTGIM